MREVEEAPSSASRPCWVSRRDALRRASGVFQLAADEALTALDAELKPVTVELRALTAEETGPRVVTASRGA